jgi:hypothetical protein
MSIANMKSMSWNGSMKIFGDQANLLRDVRFWIPQLHIHGHNDDCQYRYSLSFADGVGRTHGEGIETCWAEQNQIGGMIKEMGKGHRHNTLEDFSGDWNWLKAQQMGTVSSSITVTLILSTS